MSLADIAVRIASRDEAVKLIKEMDAEIIRLTILAATCRHCARDAEARLRGDPWTIDGSMYRFAECEGCKCNPKRRK